MAQWRSGHGMGVGLGAADLQGPPALAAERQGLLRLMETEGHDLSKFALVAVPEAFSDLSGTDRLGHGGLLEYDGILDVEHCSDDESLLGDPAQGFDVTIEHVDSLGHGSADIQLMDLADHNTSLQHFHNDDVLDVGIEANDLNSLLEQFEENESEQPKMKEVQEAESPQPKAVTPQPKAVTPQKKAEPPKQFPNPADVVKKIAPVKRKTAILLESDSLPLKKTKARPVVSKSGEINKAIQLARTTAAGSPIPFNLKTLIPPPKYLSMEHDYCLSPAHSENSSASEFGSQMSKEARRAYYKNKYKVKKKLGAADSPAQGSSVSSSPASMSPVRSSPDGTEEEGQEGNGGEAPAEAASAQHPPVPLFDKIPSYFSSKLLVGMYREINAANPEQPEQKGYRSNVFRAKSNNNEEVRENAAAQPTEGCPRTHRRRSRPRAYRTHRTKRNSLSSQSESSDCGSLSAGEQGEMRSPSPYRGRPRRTRESVCSMVSRSHSRSRSRSLSCSSCSSYGSRTYSRSRQRSYSRSVSYSRSRSRSYSRSRSRSYSRSPSYSRSRSRGCSHSHSRSRSPCRDPSRTYSRSVSRSPHRSRSRSSRPKASLSRNRTLSRARSQSSQHSTRSKSSRYRTFDPNSGSKEVKYTKEQLQEFEERRVLYIGNVTRETTKVELMKQFSRFGRVDKVSLHFREDQDSYGFVTFRYSCDAVAALKSGPDPNWPNYDLCFGGRRKFCRTQYEDLDSLNKASADLEFGYSGSPPAPRAEESEFDKLLKAAMKGVKSAR